MKLIKDQELISNFWQTKPLKKRKINNEQAAIRADWIDKCAKLVNRPYPQMASLLFPLKTVWIQELYETALSFPKNPPALFWTKLKEYKLTK